MAVGLLSGLAYPASADDRDAAIARMYEAHATLLDLESTKPPEQLGGADIYYSLSDDPKAPRLVTRLRVVPDMPCRSRVISLLQFPGQWANVTIGIVELAKATRAVAYGSVKDLISEKNPVPINSPVVEHVVLTGKGLFCTSRLSLGGNGDEREETCSDRLDLSMIDDDGKARGRRVLDVVANVCHAPALADTN